MSQPEPTPPDAELSILRSQVQELIHHSRQHPVITTQVRKVAQEGPLQLQSCRIVRLNTGIEDQLGWIDYCNGGRYTAMVIPQFDDGRIQLLLRYRPAIARWSLELPRSTASNDESGWRLAAQSELAESTGLICGEMKLLGSTTIDPCYLTASALVVLASGCEMKQAARWDEERLIAGTVVVSETALPHLILSGEIDCGLTLAALSIYFAQRATLPHVG